MRMDRLTSKFQEALADAQSLAVGRDHQFIEPVHLMIALLDQQGGSVRPLLSRTRASTSTACARSSASCSTSRRRSRAPAVRCTSRTRSASC